MRPRTWGLVVVAAVIVTAALAGPRYLLDREPPPREPLDRVWHEWMLAGHSGHWVNGVELPWPISLEDRIAHHPAVASNTKYAIRVEHRGVYGEGGWILWGGLVDRAEISGAVVELFGKEIIRVHWPDNVRIGRDYRYEFFLVVRSEAGGRGRLVRQWAFPPEEVTLAVPPKTAEGLRKISRSEEEALRLIEQQRSHYLVAGHLRVEQTTAIVTILGMVRPVEERIDLTAALRP